MAIFKDTIMIKDRPYDRAVELTVIAPDDMNVLNVQELAEKAWRSVNKCATSIDPQALFHRAALGPRINTAQSTFERV